MASYEEWYRSDKDEPVKQLIASLWKGSRYLQVNINLMCVCIPYCLYNYTC